MRIDTDVEMTARDGVVLRADVIRPDISAKGPAIVVLDAGPAESGADGPATPTPLSDPGLTYGP